MTNDAITLKVLGAGLLLAACATAQGIGAQVIPAPQVTIQTGTLQGVSDGTTELFKGIPFAAPPMGELRWAPPQPAPHWAGVREAATFGNDCMQQVLPLPGLASKMTLSEDCLYVNVWRPKDARNAPVMVWIYGGGLVMGSSATPDGTPFARDGVIFVSFNYRVGRFGFFGFPALTAANPDGLLVNYGYMDQIAALKWVKANIAAFGGDPGNVTIFGESSGGGSVLMLLTSPMASGLFQKAIVESGGGGASPNGYRLVSKDLPNLPSAETIGVNFAKANGIEGIGPEALKALRALPAGKVVFDLRLLAPDLSGSGLPPYPGPVADGKVVIAYPDEMYEANRFAHVPLIIGATSADLAFPTAKSMDEALAPSGPTRKGRWKPTTRITRAIWAL